MPNDVRMSLSNVANHEEPVHATYATHTATSWHSHDFYELVFVVEGFCMHHLRDAVSLTMEGDVLFIKPGASHRYSGTQECKIINCLFTEDAFREIRDTLLSLPGIAPLLGDSDDGFLQMHLDIRERKSLHKLLDQTAKECREKQNGWQLKIKALLYSVLVDCSRIYAEHHGAQSKEDAYPGYVTRALGYIEAHYGETLSVQGLGEYVGISPDYLSRQFRQVTGIAVQEYVRRYRLSRAITCLQRGCTIGETAKKCGFQSIGYFSREFKKEMGMAPSLYAKQQA